MTEEDLSCTHPSAKTGAGFCGQPISVRRSPLFRWPWVSARRSNRNRTRQIAAQYPQEEKFPVGIYACLFLRVVPQCLFWEHIGEKRRYPGARGSEFFDESPELVLEGKAQGRPFWVVDPILI